MVHEGVKYDYYNYCDHKTTQYDNLTAHKMLVHEGAMFDCNNGNYRATWQLSLTSLIKLVYENVCFTL